MTKLRNTLAPAMAGLFLTSLPVLAQAASSEVECTLFVGGKPSTSQQFQLNPDGSGQGSLYLEANMFTADVTIDANRDDIRVGMTLTRLGSQTSSSDITYILLRANQGSSHSESVSATNSRLSCTTR